MSHEENIPSILVLCGDIVGNIVKERIDVLAILRDELGVGSPQDSGRVKQIAIVKLKVFDYVCQCRRACTHA